tara:strand:- start:60 stop:290 length:231 start_codon:yes stop_codon:yes gene_type:complete
MPITVDIEKAKEITKERLRIERKPLLEKQDVLFNKALEENLSTTDIIIEKNRLRNITNEVDNLTTLEELKNITVEG